MLPSNKPNVGIQGSTGVLDRYRNRGLGRWLKAAMLEKLLAERPWMRYIRTYNADMNEPMLKINHALGFEPYAANNMCQAQLETVAAYLKEKGLY